MKFSWRKLEFEEGEIEVRAELGPFGPEKWILTVSTKNNQIVVKTQKHGLIPSLAKKIREIENYWNLLRAENLKMDLVDYETICKFWIDLVRSAHENKLRIHADVARISSSTTFEIKGMKVIPKDWDNPIEDEILVQLCNLWVTQVENGEYANKTIFQFVGHDAEKFRKVSARESTVYISLSPIEDKDLILKILMNADLIYLPDITTIGNLRAIKRPLKDEEMRVD